MAKNAPHAGECSQAADGHVSSGGQRNGVPCQDEDGAQRLGSKKLHVSFDTIM